MLIYFIGPGGAGKTTTAKLLAAELKCVYHDLDEYFMQVFGNISEYIAQHGYPHYANRNVQLFLELQKNYEIKDITIIVCSSGFMTYPDDIHKDYVKIKAEIENHHSTFLLLPSLDREECIQEILRRQMSRTYLNSSLEKEKLKISTRFALYTKLECHIILTHQLSQMVVFEIKEKIEIHQKSLL